MAEGQESFCSNRHHKCLAKDESWLKQIDRVPGECLESADLAVAVDDFLKPAKCFPRKAELDRAPNLKQAWHMVQDSTEADAKSMTWIFVTPLQGETYYGWTSAKVPQCQRDFENLLTRYPSLQDHVSESVHSCVIILHSVFMCQAHRDETSVQEGNLIDARQH